MSVRTVLTRLLSTDTPTVVVECRQCGTTLSPDTDECAACGSTDIGQYSIPK